MRSNVPNHQPVPIDKDQLAAHIDRFRRRCQTLRPEIPACDIRGGLMTVVPDAPVPEHASIARDRVLWLAGESPVGRAEIDTAIKFARRYGRRRFFAWFGPKRRDGGTDAALRAVGATRVPHVTYVALARRAGDAPPVRVAPEIVVRLVPPEGAKAVFDAVRSWYGEESAAINLMYVLAGMIELHAAFIGAKPIAVSLLTPDAQWAYLGGMGTDPAHRGLGAQKALIAARLRRARDLGAHACAAETNDVEPMSLSNLLASGFEIPITWSVFRVDLDAPHTP